MANMEYFQQKRTQILTESQILISYHWRKHRQHLEQLKEQEKEKMRKKQDRSLSLHKRNKASDGGGVPRINYDKAGPTWGFGSQKKQNNLKQASKVIN